MLIFEKLAALFTEEPLCPQFGVKCRKHRCHAYGERHGFNHDTGEKVMEHGCTINEFAPLLAIENTVAARGIHAELTQLRELVVQEQKAGFASLAAAVTTGLTKIGVALDEQESIRITDDSIRSGNAFHGDNGSPRPIGQSASNGISHS